MKKSERISRVNSNSVLRNCLEFIYLKSGVDNILGKICERNIYIRSWEVNFNKLIPQPIYLYKGFLDKTQDFHDIIESDWNYKNWGTKGNAYNTDLIIEDAGDNSNIKLYFDIENSSEKLPYNIIVAIGNIIKTNFKYRYYATDESIWGAETWSDTHMNISREEKRFKGKDDLLDLRKEFLVIDDLVDLLVSESLVLKKAKK